MINAFNHTVFRAPESRINRGSFGLFRITLGARVTQFQLRLTCQQFGFNFLRSDGLGRETVSSANHPRTATTPAFAKGSSDWYMS